MLSIFIWYCLCIHGYSKPAHDGTNSQSAQFKIYENNIIISDVNTSPLNEHSNDNEPKRHVISHGKSADSINFNVRKDSVGDGGSEQKRQTVQTSSLAVPFTLSSVTNSDVGVAHPPEPTPLLIPSEPAPAPIPIILPNSPPVPQPSGPVVLQYPSQSPQPAQMPIVLQNPQPSCVGTPCNPPPNQAPYLVLNQPNNVPCNQPCNEPCGVPPPPPTPCNIVCNLPTNPPCPCATSCPCPTSCEDQDIHHHEYECLHKHHHYYHHHDVDDDDDNHYNDDEHRYNEDHGYDNDWEHRHEGYEPRHYCNHYRHHDHYRPDHYNDNYHFSSRGHKKSTNPSKHNNCHD